MFFSTARFWYKGWINDLFIQPKYFFTFYGFEWIKPLDGNGMYILFGVLLLTTLLITFGLFYRIAIIVFFLGFTYVELIDKTNYLNHYYFISLMAFLLCIVPAHRRFSLDVKFGFTSSLKYIPAWCINIFKFQIGCVYFFAGVAKVNYYWLFEAQPLSNWLKHQTDLALIGGLMKYKTTAYLFSWFGCLFDLTTPFLLLFKKTRVPAYVLIILFHAITGIMFPIGVFPIVMIVLTTLFFSPRIYINLFNRFKSSAPNISQFSTYRSSKRIRFFVMLYVSIQLLIPFRYALYPGNLFWTEQGYRFSWRVMLIEKVGYVNFYVVPENGKGKKVIDLSNYLTLQQTKQMSTQPDMILQFAHHLNDIYRDQEIIENGDTIHIGNPKVYVQAEANLFNKGTKQLIDPTVDMSEVPFNLKHRTWISSYDQ